MWGSQHNDVCDVASWVISVWGGCHNDVWVGCHNDTWSGCHNDTCEVAVIMPCEEGHVSPHAGVGTSTPAVRSTTLRRSSRCTQGLPKILAVPGWSVLQLTICCVVWSPLGLVLLRGRCPVVSWERTEVLPWWSLNILVGRRTGVGSKYLYFS